MSSISDSPAGKGAAQPNKQMPVFPEMPGLAFWAGFCGIISIVIGIINIGTGFLPALAISGNNIISIMGGTILGAVFILSGVSLLESARQLKKYIQRRQLLLLENAFKRTSLYFRICGILVIISIFLILLVFIVILLVIGMQSI